LVLLFTAHDEAEANMVGK
jgi:hypothetical protein